MGRRRVLPILVAACVLVVTAACVPVCNWDWFPFVGGDCRTRLDDDTLDRLTLSMGPTVEMQPGGTREFTLGVVECCYFFEPVDACATWSVEPSDGASINSRTGVFILDDGVASGEVFTVTADVEDGRRLVSIEVHVFTPGANPLVRNWGEEAQLACDTREEVAPEEPIRELQFRADGTFSVTWMPFEVYRDYWGNYRYDSEGGTLDLAIEGGNYVPEDVDGSGSFVIDEEGRLVLKDMWLGTWMASTGDANCGHIFN